MPSLVRSDYFYETRRWVLPDKIVASRITMGSGTTPDIHLDGFKPYVYRGTGEDTLTDGLDLDEWGAVVPPPPPQPTKRDHKNRAYRWLRVLRDEIERQRRAAIREQHRQEYRTRPKPRLLPPAPEPAPARWQPTSGEDIDALLSELGGA